MTRLQALKHISIYLSIYQSIGSIDIWIKRPWIYSQKRAEITRLQSIYIYIYTSSCINNVYMNYELQSTLKSLYIFYRHLSHQGFLVIAHGFSRWLQLPSQQLVVSIFLIVRVNVHCMVGNIIEGIYYFCFFPLFLHLSPFPPFLFCICIWRRKNSI